MSGQVEVVADAARLAWCAPLLGLAGAVERGSVAAGQCGRVLEWEGRAATAYRRRVARERGVLLGWSRAMRDVARAIEAGAEGAVLAGVVQALVSFDALSTNPSGAWPTGAPAGASPSVARAWWMGLSPEQRHHWEVTAGPEVGQLDGVPYEVRDRVNRVTVAQDVAMGVGGTAVARALQRPGARVVDYSRGNGPDNATAVVAVGEVESARSVVVVVPGLGSTQAGTVGQVRRVERVLDAAEAAGAQSAAGLAWLGYDAPDDVLDPSLFTTDRASEAGAALAQDLQALELERAEVSDGRTTVVGHSFGSSVVGEALVGVAGPEVEAAVFVGSPGAGMAQQASDLAADEVYAMRERRDLVGMLGTEGSRVPGDTGARVGLGVDPTSEDFGAVVLPADRPDGSPWPGLGKKHSGYFDEGSRSLEQIGGVVAKRGG